MASITSSATKSVLLLALIAMAGLAAAAADEVPAPALPPGVELDGPVECMLGCYPKVFGCFVGCFPKGPYIPICLINCDHKFIVCVLRCAVSPPPPPTPPSPPPSPYPPSPPPYPPPTPTPPSPRPKPPPRPRPRPPGPYPPPPAPAGTPYAGDGTETSA